MITPSMQAAIDWRDEGCFRPSQYQQGSTEQKEYLAEQYKIKQREADSNEHYDFNFG